MNTEIDFIKEQWHDFKFEMPEMKTKYATLKKQFLENKLKFRKTLTEWTLDHILNAHQENSDCPFIIELARIASIIPVTYAWPERGASAVKLIKSRTGSSMKNDLSKALIHISLNGPPVHSKEADILLNKVTDICHSMPLQKYQQFTLKRQFQVVQEHKLILLSMSIQIRLLQ